MKMESDVKELKRNETSISSKHISKLHERVQTKYNEMQKRLEKTKSTDILSSLNENDVLVNNNNFDTEQTQIEKNIHLKNSKQNMVLEDDRRNDAKCCEIEYKEAVISGKINTVPIVNLVINDTEKPKDENEILLGMSLQGSLESLTEVKDSDDSMEIITIQPKSFRSRLRSRIREARKRRQIEKEKNAKNKKVDAYTYNDKLVLSNTTKAEITKVYKKTKLATVSIALIEVTGFKEVDEEKPRFISCRFRLGTEKIKSKVIKSHESIFKFQELHSLGLYDDDNIMEIVLWDKYVQLARSTIDLSALEKEKTHRIKICFNDLENVEIFFLLTISGLFNDNTLFNINENETYEEVKEMRRKYAWYKILDDFTNVGWLSIIVYGAKGLSGNDCYCILTLNNERIYTATDYKTNNPNWMQVFKFELSDITSILEITVYDERKGEEVGNISIPLLNIQTGKKWYALKDSAQRERAKGNNPRILLEMNVTWNLVKASLRVIKPKETNLLKTEDKLDRHLLARNIARGRVVVMWVVNAAKTIKTCFEWESRQDNVIYLAVWLLFCHFFKIWMLPLLLLLPFVRYYQTQNGTKITDPENIQKEKEEKSFRQKIQDFQETIQTIQNFVGKVVSLAESIKNLYNFSVPFVSCLAIFLISAIAFIMYLIPLQYILMIWGIRKFTRKILKPNTRPHSEVLDLLSRVPDDITLNSVSSGNLSNPTLVLSFMDTDFLRLNCKELPLEYVTDEEKQC